MPSRMIREGYLDSEAYASVDDSAKLVWHHMLSLADDFGCLSLAPTFIRRRLFYTQPSDATVSRVLEQLQSADLIRIYAHGDGRFAFIPRFRQRLKRSSLKHPAPPQSLYQDDPHAAELFNEIKKETGKTPAVGPEVSRKVPAVGRAEEKRREVEEKKGHAPLALPDWLPREPWLAWIESRKKLRKPPTEYAQRLAINALAKLRDQGHDVGEVINASVMGGWSGFFAPDKKAAKANPWDGVR